MLKKAGSRMTVIDTIYYQVEQSDPISAQGGFSRWTDSDEQHYPRRMKVGEEWTPIDPGWFKGDKVGQLLIVNEKTVFTTIPTPQEKAEAEAKVLEVMLSPTTLGFPTSPKEDDRPKEDVWLVLPGESMRGMPEVVGGLFLRCRKGETRAVVTLFPR